MLCCCLKTLCLWQLTVKSVEADALRKRSDQNLSILAQERKKKRGIRSNMLIQLGILYKHSRFDQKMKRL